MRIAVTLVLPILLILSLLGFDFYSRHLGQERPAACASDRPVGSPPEPRHG